MNKREILADILHEIWASWMKHVFSACVNTQNTGELAIPAKDVERRKKLIETKYKDLPEEEKDKDREQADKILKALNNTCPFCEDGDSSCQCWNDD
jgi:hypothetical protein